MIVRKEIIAVNGKIIHGAAIEEVTFTIPRWQKLAEEFRRKADINQERDTVRVGGLTARRLGMAFGFDRSVDKWEILSSEGKVLCYRQASIQNLDDLITDLAYRAAAPLITEKDKNEGLKAELRKRLAMLEKKGP